MVKSNVTDVANTLKSLRSIEGDPLQVSTDLLQNMTSPAGKYDVMTQYLMTGSMQDGSTYGTMLAQALSLDTRRRAFYREVRQSTVHPFVIGSLELYVDTAAGTSSVTGRSVWCTSEDVKIKNEVNQLFMGLRIDDNIRDWAMKTARDGDLFIRPYAEKGLGVMFVDDTILPEDMERIDINGRLEGFINMRADQGGNSRTVSGYKVEAPWDYVHMRVFGGSSSGSGDWIFGNLGTPDRAISAGAGADSKTFRVTTKYGMSMLAPAQPTYRRLKLAEDSVMMSRLTRGILWYMYKVKVDTGNAAQAMNLVKSVRKLVKRKQGMDTSAGSQNWEEKFSPVFGQVEDIFIPETDKLTVDVQEMGGTPDIRSLYDVEMLENRLLGSLRVSRAMLGITDDLPGGIGENSAGRISVNFAKTVRRLQDSLKAGLTRLAQIHLAHKGLNPDPSRFRIELAEISSAEDEETKASLDRSIDIVDRTMASFEGAYGEDLDKGALYEYLVAKFMKLDDLDIASVLKDSAKPTEALKAAKVRVDRLTEGMAGLKGDLLEALPTFQGSVLKEGEALNTARTGCRRFVLNEKMDGLQVFTDDGVGAFVDQMVHVVPEEEEVSGTS